MNPPKNAALRDWWRRLVLGDKWVDRVTRYEDIRFTVAVIDRLMRWTPSSPEHPMVTRLRAQAELLLAENERLKEKCGE